MAAESGSSGSGYRIEPLKGAENYTTWRVQAEDILQDMNYWDHVNGTNTIPTDEDDLKKWQRTDRKALTQIRLRISAPMITYVMSAKTSKDAWDALKMMFDISGPIATVLIRRKLFRYVIEEGADMEEQIRTLRGYQEELIGLGHELKDEDFAYIILTALPDSWDSFVSSLDTNDLKPAQLIGRILAETSRRKDRSGTETTLFAKKGKGKGKFRAGVKCYNCEKEGHLASECRAPKRDDARKGGRPEKAHHTLDAEDTYEFNIRDDEMVFVAQSDIWLADSATQSHIVLDRNLFTDYRLTPGSNIQGAGKSQALGRGTVRVTFKVDGRDIPVTLWII